MNLEIGKKFRFSENEISTVVDILPERNMFLIETDRGDKYCVSLSDQDFVEKCLIEDDSTQPNN